MKATAAADSTSKPVVLSRGSMPPEPTKVGSLSVASKVSTTDSIWHGAWRSTAIHCGSPWAARQPVPFAPISLIRSTANQAGVGA